MSIPVDASLRGVDDCDCCTGVEARLPALIENRPGMPAVAARAGTHAAFLAGLLGGLSRSDRPALGRLTTREPDDATIAFLDSVAAVADVLTFYQERIANESLLRTAIEARSVRELARAIGYELAPGVAAETVLAFTLETAQGAPTAVVIDSATRAQSVPGPGERPQTFETTAEIEARPEWNELRPPTTEAVAPYFGQTEAYFAGTATNLRPGDSILLVGDERTQDPLREQWDHRYLDVVDADHARGATRVTWQDPLGSEAPRVEPAQQEPRFYALRLKAALFGANAPDWRLLTAEVRERYDTASETTNATEWPGLTVSEIAGTSDVVHLEGLHREILPGSWLVIARRGYEELYDAVEVDESARQGFGLTAKTTQVRLRGERLSWFDENVRDAVVYAQSELLEMANRPIATDVLGDTIELDGDLAPLEAGRLVVVAGVPSTEPADAPQVVELATVATMQGDGSGHTTLELTAKLARAYRRESVRISANVAPATHGEGTAEPLGSGDAAQALQRFALHAAPVTHVYADTPTGRRSTLDLHVDGVRWEEVPSLYARGPDERAFTLRLDDEQNAAVQFGDGRAGARLPTGRENVQATYRKGLGAEGNQDAGKVSLLLTRPLGVRGVTNPIAATGGADPEALEDARTNAPLTVLTLGRIVSLSDYADFARGFEGIAKAHATWVWGSEGRSVLVTVAGTDGAEVTQSGPVQRSLLAAMALARDPHVAVSVVSYEPVRFHLAATVGRDPARLAEQVLAGAEAALEEHFAFAARAFGQGVPLSEVLAVLHGVAGVTSVDVDSLHAGALPELRPYLAPHVPRAGEDAAAARPAQLLWIELRPGDVVVAG